MAAIRQTRPHLDLWQAIKELEFISSFFSWLFMLCSRLAEPCMLLATIYIIIEAGISSAAMPALHNLSVAIMIAAPEIILPGAFVVAKLAREKGEEARPLSFICWMFVTLTLTTLLSLFIFHFDKTAISVIMFMRCSVGVGYSMLVRMLSHSRLATPSQVNTPQPPALEITPALISMLGEQLKEHFSPLIVETIEKHLQTVAGAPVSTRETSRETSTRDQQKTAVAKPRTAQQKRPALRTSKQVAETKITSLTGRRLVSDDEIRAAYLALRAASTTGRVSAEALKLRARISKGRACRWLKHNVQEEASA